MIIKWRRVMLESPDKQGKLRKMQDYLITYSHNNKEHIESLSTAIKYLTRKDCVRIIIENGDLEK